MSQAPSNSIVCAALAAAAWACAGNAGLAAQAEFCVSCTGPQAQYRCIFSGDTSVTPKGGLQLYCITTLAREEGHESCAVDRQTAGPCNGTPKVLALPAGGLETEGVGEDGISPARAPAAAAHAAQSEPPAPAVTAPNSPPAAGVSPRGGAQAPANGAAAGKKWGESSGAPQGAKHNAADAAKGDTDESPQSPPTASGPVEKAGKAVTDAAKSTGQALEKAGTAVGRAAKKTWRCLSTLFGDC